MTDVVRQPELQVMWLTDTRASITGPLARVNTALGLLREEGRLVTTTDPQPTADGGVLVTVKVLSAVAPQPPVGPAPSAWTPRIVTILAAIVGTVLISCGVMALHGLAWVGAHGTLLLGLLAVVVLAVAFVAVNALSGGRLVEVLVRVRVK